MAIKRFFTFLFLLFVLQVNAVEFEDPGVDEPDPLAEPFNSLDVLSGEPSAIILQCVNVITGDYIDITTDLKLPGADPLSLSRFYCSSDSYCEEPMRAWKFNHDKVLYQISSNLSKRVTSYPLDLSGLILRDAFGVMLPLQLKQTKNEKTAFRVHSKVFDKRITNTSREMSGRTHLKNKTLNFTEKASIISRDGAGSYYYFKKLDSTYKSSLESMRKPNSNVILYDYDKLNLKTITALNKAGQTQGLLEFTLRPLKKNSRDIQLEVKGTGKSLATYELSQVRVEGKKKWILEKAQPYEAPKETYSYDRDFKKIVRKDLPDSRFLQIEYYQAGHNAVWPNKDYLVKSVRAGRVMRLSSPVGTNATSIPIYRFLYYLDAHKEKGGTLDIRSGHTDVYDAYDHKTSYHFGVDERLSKIENFKGIGPYHSYSNELFFWGDPGTPDAGNLKVKALTLPDGTAAFCRTYSYDPRGNVTAECLYGNLSGTCQDPLTLDGSGKPHGGECLYIGHEYTKGDYNLVAYENHPTYQHDCRYEYYPDSDLLQAKYIIDGIKVRKREFYEYDDNGAVKLEIVGDGSSLNRDDLAGVTERHVKRITNANSFPLGLPKIVEEKYWDMKTGQEHLLKKYVNIYNDEGKLKEQTVFDSQNMKAYILTWKYDKLGKVIEETNALGQTLTRTYDDNGNKIFEQGFNKDVHYVYGYDKANRLTNETEMWADGTSLNQRYEYDYLGNRLSSMDTYRQKTLYTYNEFSQQTKIIYPSQLDENGLRVNSTLEKQYDALGNVISLIDAKGSATLARYTIRGKPYYIKHPDGAEEFFEYTLKGQLIKKVARNGSYTLYNYDYLARPIKEETYSPAGNPLKCITRIYNAFHLIQETDAAGHTTDYTYDGAGRLMRIVKGSSRTDYTYDSLGCILEKREFYDNSEKAYIATRYAYDFLNRVKKETVLDSSDQIYRKLAYTYDEEGHLREEICYNQAGTSTTTTLYNPHGDLITTTDALGQTTNSQYRYRQVNVTTTTDPLERTTSLEKDALNRVVSEVKNASVKLVKKTDYRYDIVGKRRFCIETVKMPNAPDRKVVTGWNYDDAGRLVRQMEAIETPEQKTTQFFYYPSGELKTKIKPDGIELNYDYDACGRLEKQTSSDGSIHYTYDYDLNDNLIRVHDKKNNTITIKEYNAQDQLIKETLAHRLSVGYDYDNLGRLIAVRLPDQSSIRRVYAGTNLHQVLRIASNGDVLYRHTYDKYDLTGNLIQASLIGQTGLAEYKYDLLSRPVGIMTTHYKESNETFDPAGNLKIRTLQDTTGKTTCNYGYDDLDHLTSAIGGPNQHVFVYDSLSNPVLRNAVPCKINSLNQLTALGDCTYRYDLNGNRIVKKTSDQEIIYDYDALDRLIAVTIQTQKMTYTYDFSNRRLSKTFYSWNGIAWEPEQTVRYLYQGNHEIGAYDEQERNIELRVLGKSSFGSEIGAAVALELEGKVYAPLSDRTGNVVGAIKATDGSPYETYRYGPFGEEQIFDDSGNVIEQGMNPWRYASKRKDFETGFIYFGKRYYDPEIGRWLTADPAGFVDGMNLYVFNHNNPLRYIDEDGRWVMVLAPVFTFCFGIAEAYITTATVSATLGTIAVACGFYEYSKYLDRHDESLHDQRLASEAVEEKEKKKTKTKDKDKDKDKEKFTFPENPDELLPELPRDKKGHIYTADDIRIRPEKHEFEEGDKYNPRHHEQHYHIETRPNPETPWNKRSELNKLKPPGYNPGDGTGFLPGETFPGY